ncbi:MAG: DJ-1/PfpI family protein [Gemmatimonadetes bacterium]|nr:DJ-1/PfpI family protein [Gemmatimonadota bacterium]
MPSILVIVSPRDFREEELFAPLETWRSHLEVCVTSTRRGTARGMAGGTIEVPQTVSELAVHRFDAVAVIGGIGAPRHLWDSGPVARMVRDVSHRKGLTTAICYGVVVLARAGVLAGRRATGYPTSRVDIELRRGGAYPTASDLVVDAPVISASGPEAAPAFGRAVLRALAA